MKGITSSGDSSHFALTNRVIFGDMHCEARHIETCTGIHTILMRVPKVQLSHEVEMAAQYYVCGECHKRYPTHQKLFDALYEFQRTSPEPCPCGGPRDLHLTLDFQLGAGDSDFKVVSATLPDRLDSWLGQEEEEVTFYPFLVVLQRAGDNKQFCWMPYWHVTGKDARYGQHAVCLEQSQFEDLIAKLKEKTEDSLLQLV